jgi:hypothetical protein
MQRKQGPASPPDPLHLHEAAATAREALLPSSSGKEMLQILQHHPRREGLEAPETLGKSANKRTSVHSMALALSQIEIDPLLQKSKPPRWRPAWG